MSGFAHITGQADGPADLSAVRAGGRYCGLLWMLRRDVRYLRSRRARNRKGQYIDLAISEPIFALLGPQPIIFDQLGIVQNRTGNRSVNNAPRNTYRTRDGRWVALSAAAPSIVRRVLELTGGTEAADDPRFQTNLDRVRHVEAIDAIVGAWIAERDLHEVVSAFEEAGAAIAPVYDIEQIFHDPQFLARESVTTVEDEDLGPTRMQNVFPRLSRTPGSIRFTGPRIDQHRTEILEELLRARGPSTASESRAMTEPVAAAAPLRGFRWLCRRAADPRWPGGARVAVQFALNYEEGSEYSVTDGDGRTELGLAESPGGRVPAGQRDLAFETMYEFGSRVGVWRIFRLFDERDLPLTVFGCALALERNPRVAEAIARRGYDVCCHGWRWEEHFRLSEPEERGRIARAVDSITRTTGERPLGWYCRYGPSENTRRLLVEEGGFL